MTPDDDLPPHMEEFYRDYTGQDAQDDQDGEEMSDEQAGGDDIFSPPPGHEQSHEQSHKQGPEQGPSHRSPSEQEQQDLQLDEPQPDPEASEAPGQPTSPTVGEASSPQDPRDNPGKMGSSTPSPDTPTPGHEDWGQNDLLHQLGVYETGEMDPDKATQVERLVRGAEGDQPSGSVFVRGSKYGSSFLIKLGDWLMILLVIGFLGGLGYGGWWGLQKVIGGGGGNGAEPTAIAPANQNGNAELAALAQEEGWIYCQPQTIPEAQQVAVLQKLPQVITGEAQLPRDQESLRQAEGSQTEIMDSGDRKDRFSPPQAQLVVRYQGTSPDVRHITVRFDQTRSFCRSLQTLGLLDDPAAFHFSENGQVQPREGEIVPFFQEGQVYMQLENQDIRYVRLTPAQ